MPPSAPTARAFMSIANTHEQPLGGGLPPEFSGMERLIGAPMQRKPPLKGAAARPLLELIISPGLLLTMLTTDTSNPEPALALGVPLNPMLGVQPSESTFAVHDATGTADDGRMTG